MMWISKAVESLKGPHIDRASLLAALKKAELHDTPHGPEKLDAFANPIENVYVRKVEKINGKYQNTVIHTFPMVSQFWKYDPTKYLSLPASTRDYPPCKYCDQNATTKSSSSTP